MACSTHVNPIRVMESPMPVTAGGMSTPAPLGAAIFSLAEGKRAPILTGLPGYRPTVVRLAWADMSVPPVSAEDWQWIADRLKALPAGRLHVHCQMGHGRTGTALAILATLWGQVPEGQDPVTWVRTMYCPQAVETAAQVAYVARITGRTVTAEPSIPPAPAPVPYPGTVYTGGSGQVWPVEDRAWTGQRTTSAADDYQRTPPPAPRPRRDDDSLGARRERFQRYLPDVARKPVQHPVKYPPYPPVPKPDAGAGQ